MPDYLVMPDTGENKYNIDLEVYLETHFKSETYEEPKAGDRGNLRPSAILQKFIIPNNNRVECLRFLDYIAAVTDWTIPVKRPNLYRHQQLQSSPGEKYLY